MKPKKNPFKIKRFFTSQMVERIRKVTFDCEYISKCASCKLEIDGKRNSSHFIVRKFEGFKNPRKRIHWKMAEIQYRSLYPLFPIINRIYRVTLKKDWFHRN